MNEISKINVNGTAYDVRDSRVNATDIANLLDSANYVPSAAGSSSDTTYLLTINGTTAGDSTNGTNLGSIYAPTTAGTLGQALISSGSGAPTWGTVSASVSYPDVTYTVATQSTSGSISIDGSKPVHVITLTGNASAVTLSTQPAEGHSTHVFFYSTSQRTVAIAHNATTSCCPEATALSLTVKANGYVEVDFLKANGVIYVRGV